MTSGAKARSGVMISTVAARACDNFGGLQPGVVAGIVENQDIDAGLHIAGDDVPRRDDEFVSFGEDVRVRHTAGRDDDDVRIFGLDGFRFRPCVEAKGHAELFALRHAPVDDADHFLAA
jgi:hypothetical protein